MFDGFGGGVGLIALLWIGIIVAFWVAIIVLVLLAIRWLIRNTGPGNGAGRMPRPGEDVALATLRERFARGEIDATEFEERKRTLGG